MFYAILWERVGKASEDLIGFADSAQDEIVRIVVRMPDSVLLLAEDVLLGWKMTGSLEFAKLLF